MKQIALVFTLMIAAVLALVTRSSSVGAVCATTRACTSANPCQVDLCQDPGEPEWCVPESLTKTCGRGCQFGAFSGADGCREGINSRDGCATATLIGPGCCSIPCLPPAVGCEPNGGGGSS